MSELDGALTALDEEASPAAMARDELCSNVYNVIRHGRGGSSQRSRSLIPEWLYLGTSRVIMLSRLSQSGERRGLAEFTDFSALSVLLIFPLFVNFTCLVGEHTKIMALKKVGISGKGKFTRTYTVAIHVFR